MISHPLQSRFGNWAQRLVEAGPLPFERRLAHERHLMAGVATGERPVPSPLPVTEAQREAAREWYCFQFDVIDAEVFDEIDAIEARDPDGLVRLHQSAMRKDAAIAAQTTASPDEMPPVEDEQRAAFTAAELDEIAAEAAMSAKPSGDAWPQTGGDAFCALTDAQWRQTVNPSDGLPGFWYAPTAVAILAILLYAVWQAFVTLWQVLS